MIYQRIEHEGLIKTYSNIITRKSAEESTYCIRSKHDFSLCETKTFRGKKFAIHYLDSVVILSDLKKYHVEVNTEQCRFVEYEGDNYRMAATDDLQLFYCPSKKKYFVTDFSGNETLSVMKNYDVESFVHGFYYVEFVLHQQKSFVRLKNLCDKQNIWQVDFKGKIVRCEAFESFIILDCFDQFGYTVVLNIESGRECWRREEVYSRVDSNSGVVLFGDDEITVVNLNDGKVVWEFLDLPPKHLGYYPCFVDGEGVYYTAHDGSFGKIKSSSKVVLWEFDLVDEEGEKRKLSNWILLENGNLVLQAIPNHPNGELTCVFNPLENLTYSKV